MMDIKKLAIDCGCSGIGDDDWQFSIKELELFAQKIIEARDKEWMAEPACCVTQDQNDNPKNIATVHTSLVPEISKVGYVLTPLYIQPKEVK